MKKRLSVRLLPADRIAFLLFFQAALYIAFDKFGGFIRRFLSISPVDVFPSLLIKIALTSLFFALPLLIWSLTPHEADATKKNSPREASVVGQIRNLPLLFIAVAFLFFLKIIYSSFFTSISFSAELGYSSEPATVLLVIIANILIPAVGAELLYRGCIGRELLSMGIVPGILLSSVLGGFCYFSLEAFPLNFFCGIILGFLYQRTRGVWLCACASTSAALLELFYFKVGNLPGNGTPILRIVLIAVLGALAFAGIIVLYSPRFRLENAKARSSAVVRPTDFYTLSMSIYFILAVFLCCINSI